MQSYQLGKKFTPKGLYIRHFKNMLKNIMLQSMSNLNEMCHGLKKSLHLRNSKRVT